MSNKDTPFGFIPIGHMSGGAIPEPHEYTLATGSTIYKGDPVLNSSAGTVIVGAASATTTHIGIAAEYVSDSGSAGGKKIKVYDDPDIIYLVQTTDSITTSISNVFNTADIITSATGSTTTKQSVMELDTPGTSSKPWLIVRLHDSPDNAWGEFSKVEVRYNQSMWMTAYAGV